MRLKSFTANYGLIFDKREVVALCRWVKWVIFSSPIEHVRLLRDDHRPYAIHIPFDNLTDHLATKHPSTLRILDVREAYVSAKAVKLLLEQCHGLEEVYIAVRKHVLVRLSLFFPERSLLMDVLVWQDVFQAHARHLPRLRSAGFNIRNAKMKEALVDDDSARQIITQGPHSLRRLAVNGAAWEVCNCVQFYNNLLFAWYPFMLFAGNMGV